MQTFDVEKMQFLHLEQVFEISQTVFGVTSWTKAQFEAELQNSFVCLANGQVIGFICLQYVIDEMTILNLATHPNFLRRGVATHLVQKAFEQAKQKQIKTIFLEVATHNSVAKQFYQKLGFEILRERKDYYPDHTNCYEMAKNL
jgi:ribosomal-protein-alanine N-acetyltransferase